MSALYPAALHPLVRSQSGHPFVPTWPRHGRRAQAGSMMAEGHREAARSVIEPGTRGGILKRPSTPQMRNEKDSCSPPGGGY
jgi:hypothetical protein